MTTTESELPPQMATPPELPAELKRYSDALNAYAKAIVEEVNIVGGVNPLKLLIDVRNNSAHFRAVIRMLERGEKFESKAFWTAVAIEAENASKMIHDGIEAMPRVQVAK